MVPLSCSLGLRVMPLLQGLAVYWLLVLPITAGPPVLGCGLGGDVIGVVLGAGWSVAPPSTRGFCGVDLQPPQPHRAALEQYLAGSHA